LPAGVEASSGPMSNSWSATGLSMEERPAG
jgi:hypothetical protein